MTPSTDDHAFILKLYRDDAGALRGNITHAFSRRSHPVRQPEDVLVFLEPYLTEMDVKLYPKSRLLLWLSRRVFPTRTERNRHG